MKLTKDEVQWLKTFNFSNHNNTRRAWRLSADIMMLGTKVKWRIVQPFKLCNIDMKEKDLKQTFMLSIDDYPISSCVDRYLHRSNKRINPNMSKSYVSTDYWCPPELWFTKNWVNKVNDLIDIERGRTIDQGFQESEVPGVTYKNKSWYVHRFHDGKSKFIGRFQLQVDAEKELIEYNRKIVKQGYGVNYK